MILQKNVVGWFEIPVKDMNRAMIFYQEVFGFTLTKMQMRDLEMALFPSVEDGMGAAGALVYEKKWYTPSTEGVLIYFTPPSGDLSVELARVEKAGGQIIVPKKQISEEIGYMAVFVDTEGNRVAMHSRR